MMRNFILLTCLFLLIACEKEQGQITTEDNNPTSLALKDIPTLEAFNQQVSSGVSLMFFHATWCPKCAAQRPAIEGLLGEDNLKSVFFGQVDYEKVNDVAKSAKVVGFPTILFFRDGKEEGRLNGQGHSSEKIRTMLLELL